MSHLVCLSFLFILPFADTSVVKLTGAAFRDSTLYFNRIETREMVQRYEKFIMGVPTSHPNLKVSSNCEKYFY